MNTSRSEGPTERRASLVNINNEIEERAHDIQCAGHTIEDTIHGKKHDRNRCQYCRDLEDEQCESRGVTAGPYLVIAVLAALLGIAIWLLL